MSLVLDQITHFYTKIAGVTFPNPDGSSRQEFIQKCRPDEQVFLEPEPDNRFDPNAVRVVRKTDEQLGYLPAGLAESVAAGLRDGVSFVGFVSCVLTPDDAYDTYGLQLLVVEVPRTATSEDFRAYMDQLSPELVA